MIFIRVVTDGDYYYTRLPLEFLLLNRPFDLYLYLEVNEYHKAESMPELKLKQLQSERDMWKRLLSFIKDENVHLKYRLAEILKHNSVNYSLEDVENFYSRFLKEDELIELLRNEIAALDKLMSKDVLKDGTSIRKLDDKFRNLRKEIEMVDQQFSRLKSGFNRYLSENM